MLNDHPFPGKPPVIRLFPLGKLAAFAYFLRYLAVGVKARYSQISEVRLYQD
jgi:hypothetical protein